MDKTITYQVPPNEQGIGPRERCMVYLTKVVDMHEIELAKAQSLVRQWKRRLDVLRGAIDSLNDLGGEDEHRG